MIKVRIVVKQIKTYSNKFKVWREGGTVGRMVAEMGTKKCDSPEEVLEEVKRLLPRIAPEVERKIDEAEKILLNKQ